MPKMQRYTRVLVQLRSVESRGEITAAARECASLLVCNAVSTRLDKAQHIFLSSWIVWEEKNKEKDTATAMKQVHLRQDMKDFIGWSSQQPYLSLQGTLNWAAGWVLLKPLVPQLWVGLWLLEGTKKLGYLTAQPCLSSSVVFPRCGERKGTVTLSRLACTARALLYPPLPNTARAALWDLTNPLLFQGLRVLAALLIPPAPFFLWLHMLERIGLYILRDFLQSSLSGTLGRFALMVPTFLSAPLRDLSEFQYLSALL